MALAPRLPSPGSAAPSLLLAMRRALLAAFALGLFALPVQAGAQKFSLAGDLYNKMLYRNDDSGGCLTYGNPFWPDGFSGDNGACSAFTLTAKARVSRWVSAMVVAQTFFGATWQDYYENGNIKYPQPNTSGESLGMSHSMTLYLPGFGITLKPPLPTVTQVLIGSSDLDMFNPWTIGQVRYIERFNPKGVFWEGRARNNTLAYNLGAIALPKEWAGPGWSTGLGESSFFPQNSLVAAPFTQNDWAYAGRVVLSQWSWGNLAFTGDFSNDVEANIYDPNAQGSLAPQQPATCGANGQPVTNTSLCNDGTVDTVLRYRSYAATAESKMDLDRLGLGVDWLAAYSGQRINPSYIANGVALNNGFFPIVYKNTDDVAGKLRITAGDLWDTLGWRNRPDWDARLQLEGFYIGPNFNAVLGARREADVLLTDGIAAQQQLPTLNIANELIDFDEPFAESIIGWEGGTAVLRAAKGNVTIKGEYTYIDYSTNMQGRPVNGATDASGKEIPLNQQIYPTFLHSNGYTDTSLYSYSDPASIDRGRDPRSVYAEYQARHTQIGVLWLQWLLPWKKGWELDTKLKGVFDRDGRNLTYAPAQGTPAFHRCQQLLAANPGMTPDQCDDYAGNIYIGRAALGYQLTDQLKVFAGGQLDRWLEANREGSNQSGYLDYDTHIWRTFVEADYLIGGATARYYLEYINKNVFRESEPSLFFGVFRSIATLDVAW